jgi:hypothetical protein
MSLSQLTTQDEHLTLDPRWCVTLSSSCSKWSAVPISLDILSWDSPNGAHPELAHQHHSVRKPLADMNLLNPWDNYKSEEEAYGSHA